MCGEVSLLTEKRFCSVWLSAVLFGRLYVLSKDDWMVLLVGLSSLPEVRCSYLWHPYGLCLTQHSAFLAIVSFSFAWLRGMDSSIDESDLGSLSRRRTSLEVEREGNRKRPPPLRPADKGNPLKVFDLYIGGGLSYYGCRMLYFPNGRVRSTPDSSFPEHSGISLPIRVVAMLTRYLLFYRIRTFKKKYKLYLQLHKKIKPKGKGETENLLHLT